MSPSMMCDHGLVPCAPCQAASIVRAVREVEARHEEWKQEATNQAHEYANEHNLCEAFDDFMESIGLRRRMKNWTVTVRVVTEVEIEVEAFNAKAAERAVDDEAVTDAVSRESLYNWTVEDVTES